jgi:hypothetical protein
MFLTGSQVETGLGLRSAAVAQVFALHRSNLPKSKIGTFQLA